MGRGGGLRWEGLDVDLSVPGLLSCVFAGPEWLAELGRIGGRCSSAAKAAAARRNGRKGGRPRIREQILSVRKAFELLADHPLLGRPAEEGRREPILWRGRYGHIAKCRWLPAEDVVLILAVRHQLEAGYAGE